MQCTEEVSTCSDERRMGSIPFEVYSLNDFGREHLSLPCITLKTAHVVELPGKKLLVSPHNFGVGG